MQKQITTVFIFVGLLLYANSVFSQERKIQILHEDDFVKHVINLSTYIRTTYYDNVVNGNMTVYADRELHNPISTVEAKRRCRRTMDIVGEEIDPNDPYNTKDVNQHKFENQDITQMQIFRLGKADITLREFSVGLGYDSAGFKKCLFYVNTWNLLTYSSNTAYDFIYDFFQVSFNNGQTPDRTALLNNDNMVWYAKIRYNQCRDFLYYAQDLDINLYNTEDLKKAIPGDERKTLGQVFANGVTYKLPADSVTGIAYLARTKKSRTKLIAAGVSVQSFTNGTLLVERALFLIKKHDLKHILRPTIDTYYSSIRLLKDCINEADRE